jgi:hypothetical protein
MILYLDNQIWEDGFLELVELFIIPVQDTLFAS